MLTEHPVVHNVMQGAQLTYRKLGILLQDTSQHHLLFSFRTENGQATGLLKSASLRLSALLAQEQETAVA